LKFIEVLNKEEVRNFFLSTINLRIYEKILKTNKYINQVKVLQLIRKALYINSEGIQDFLVWNCSVTILDCLLIKDINLNLQREGTYLLLDMSLAACFSEINDFKKVI
jgi:hypothetical protein